MQMCNWYVLLFIYNLLPLIVGKMATLSAVLIPAVRCYSNNISKTS